MPVKFMVIDENNAMREPSTDELPHIHAFMRANLWLPDLKDYAVGDYEVPGVGLVVFMTQQGNGKPQ